MRSLLFLAALLFSAETAGADECGGRAPDPDDRFATAETRLIIGSAEGQGVSVTLPRGQRAVYLRNAGDLSEVHVPSLNLTGFADINRFASECTPGRRRTRADFNENQIARILVAQSRAAYRGTCACPYDADSAGRSCGERSAYHRPRGEAPLCYTRQVTPGMIEDFRRG